MTEHIYRSQPGRLASLLGVGIGSEPVWQTQDLGHILAHQLEAPLLFDIARLAQGKGDGPMAPAQPRPATLRSLNELLHHPQPPLELLRLMKEFAKVSDARPDAPLPREVATVLYYASILVAMLRHRKRITELSDESLVAGFGWVLRQPWVDARTRSLFDVGLDQLFPNRHSPETEKQ